jgi:NADH-quinone oxidoreductase subunit H
MKEFLVQYEALIRLVLFLVVALAIVGLNAAYLVWVERKAAGYFQRRPGPTECGYEGLLQPIADAVKLLSKQMNVPPHADKILFWVAPVLTFAPPFLTLSVIPWGADLAARDLNYGLLLAFSFGSLSVMALMLGGWSSRNKYSIISSARAVSQNVAYEIPMLLVVVTMIMVTGTMSLGEVIEQQAGGFWNWNIIRGVWTGHNILAPVTFAIFFTCMLAETNRAPFDLAEAESELVAGSFIEYAGMGFGLFFMAEYANIVVGCAIATVLFLGGWQPPFGTLPGIWGTLIGPLFFCAKMYALIFIVVWVRWTFPRTQFYGLLNLSWKLLIPLSLFTLLLSGALIKIF